MSSKESFGNTEWLTINRPCATHKNSISAPKPRVSKIARGSKFRIGSIVSTLSIGKLLPLEEGRKKEREKECLEQY